MIPSSKRGTRISRLLAVAFPLLLAGCTSAYSGPQGMRTPGLDGPMLTAANGPTLSDAGTGAAGCQGLVRSVIVCANGDERCVRHEERHAREGEFHP
jgi:hypothetical protein